MCVAAALRGLGAGRRLPGALPGAVTYFHSSVGSGDPREPDTRARGTQLSAPRRAAACALTVPTPEVAWRRRAWFLTPGRTRSGCCSCEACRACGVCTAGTCWPPSTCHPSPSSATWAVSTARARRRRLSRCGRGASEPQLSPGALDGRAQKRPRTAGAEGCRAPSCHRLEPTTEVRAEGWTQPRLSGRRQDLPRLPGPRPRPRVSRRDRGPGFLASSRDGDRPTTDGRWPRSSTMDAQGLGCSPPLSQLLDSESQGPRVEPCHAHFLVEASCSLTPKGQERFGGPGGRCRLQLRSCMF